jgi:hypothetical protein
MILNGEGSQIIEDTWYQVKNYGLFFYQSPQFKTLLIYFHESRESRNTEN